MTTTTLPFRPRLRPATVLRPADVVDDETLHPGTVVWLGEPRLDRDERARFDDAVRRAAMRCHPSAQPSRLHAV